MDVNQKKLLRKAFMVVFLVISGLGFATGIKEEKEEGQIQELVVFSHKVHKDAIVGRPGGGINLVDAFLIEYPNVKAIKFIDGGKADNIKDKLWREAALPQTEFDIGLVFSPWLSAIMLDLFEPTNEFMRNAPLEDPDDFFISLREQLVINGKTMGVPMRSGCLIFFYNEKILRDRGLSEKPINMEEVIEYMRISSFTQPNGEEVYGLTRQGTNPDIVDTLAVFSRAKNSDYISSDFKSQLTDPRIIESVELFRDFFKSKVIPPNFTALNNADSVQIFKSGRGVYTVASPDYLGRFTKEDGLPKEDVGFMNVPAAKEYKEAWPYTAPVRTFQWAFVIPKGAQHKKMSWEFIRFMTSKKSILNMCLTGNNPVRNSILNNEKYAQAIPYRDEMQNILTYGRPFFPPFDNFAEAHAIMGREMQSAILGQKPVEQAMLEAEEAIIPLLPEE